MSEGSSHNSKVHLITRNITMNCTKIVLYLCSIGIVFSSISLLNAKSAQASEIELPFESGSIWYVCQGYNGTVSHKGKYALALDLTVGNGDFGNNNACWASDGNVNRSRGKKVLAPASGTIQWVDKDTICLDIGENRSLMIGHMRVEVSKGQTVNQDTTLGTVAEADYLPRIGGFAHIHIQAYKSNKCIHGTSVPFTAEHGFRFRGVGDLPASETHWKRALTRP